MTTDPRAAPRATRDPEEERPGAPPEDASRSPIDEGPEVSFQFGEDPGALAPADRADPE